MHNLDCTKNLSSLQNFDIAGSIEAMAQLEHKLDLMISGIDSNEPHHALLCYLKIDITATNERVESTMRFLQSTCTTSPQPVQ